jgi:NNP family nitrate/nitrite transporter-like MFS transporter
MFMILFAASGVGNASTFRMIPVIFMTERQQAAAGKGKAAEDQAIKDANKEGAAVLGFSAAVAAYGAFFIPRMFGTSIAMTGGADAALYGFIAFYVSCLAITWWFYSRKNAAMPC